MPSTRYVLDTHFYVDILRGNADAATILRFATSQLTAIDFHAIVGAELLMGAANTAASTAIRQRIVDRFKPTRVLVPDAEDMLAAGDALRMLRQRDGAHPEHDQRSFWNDVLIAVSCRRRGRVLISRDQDHARIAGVVKHQVRPTLPGSS